MIFLTLPPPYHLNGHMIETDEPVCVSICLDVYVAFQDQNKQKIADLAH